MESTKQRTTLSTTALIRKALGEVDGDVSGAIGLLNGWSGFYPNAKAAAGTIRARAKGATRVQIENSGFISAVLA